jgi:hypothetical protein
MRSGMDYSGKPISGLAYLRQRIQDVIQTPKGSLVYARNFGSDFHKMIDQNVDDDWYMDVYIMLFDTFGNPDNGVDDFKIGEVSITSVQPLHYELSIDGELLNNGESIQLNNIVIQL